MITMLLAALLCAAPASAATTAWASPVDSASSAASPTASAVAAASPAAATAAASARPKAEVRTVTFVTDIHCAKCVRKLNDNLAFEKGVKDLKVDLDAKTVTFKYDPAKTTPERLAAAINKLGYKAEPVPADASKP